jgi:hypothetical protein
VSADASDDTVAQGLLDGAGIVGVVEVPLSELPPPHATMAPARRHTPANDVTVFIGVSIGGRRREPAFVSLPRSGAGTPGNLPGDDG